MDSSNRYGGRRLAEKLGPIGIWNWALQQLSGEREVEATRAFETLGYPVTWIPETLGNKELFSHAAILLAGTSRMVVASGIANIHARDPMAMANGARALRGGLPGPLRPRPRRQPRTIGGSPRRHVRPADRDDARLSRRHGCHALRRTGA